MKNNAFPTEIMAEAIASFEKGPAMRLNKLATRTELIQWCEVNAVEHSGYELAALYTTQVMTEELEDLVVSEPDLTSDDWRNLAFILERRIDYCETQMALINTLNGAADEVDIDSYKHFEAERSLADALFMKIDERRPLPDFR